ncbi:MAG: endonuclease/exonuclease/phosphatase family protein [Sphingobacteriaceae bacterium]
MRRNKKQLSFVSKSVLFVNAVAILLLLLAYLAPFINPARFWPIAFFGLAYPFVLLLNALLVVFWLFRKPVYAFASLMAILLGWKFLTSFIGFRESTAIEVPKSSPEFIRVMTYNVHSFKKFGSSNEEIIKYQMLNIIRKEQPDVICFQEFYTRQKGAYNFKKLIKEILHTEYMYFEPTTENGFEAMGLAIFSKFPIKNKGDIRFSEKARGNEAIYADIKYRDQLFRVYNVHFQSIRFKPEDYEYLNQVKSDIKTDIRSPRRIASRLKRAFIKRSQQVKLVKAHTQNCETPYLIAGDFNDTPVSYTLNTMASGMTNAFREKGSGLGVTYNGDFPNFQIDYILSTPNFKVKNFRIVDKKLSDHYAVRADLELDK